MTIQIAVDMNPLSAYRGREDTGSTRPPTGTGPGVDVEPSTG